MGFWIFVAIMIVGCPIAFAVAARIRSGSTIDPAALRESQDRLEEMEVRLEDTTHRLADFEERLDFAERMLAQEKARQQLNS